MTELLTQYTQTHTHTLEYYSAIKKNKILSLIIMWINLKGIVPSEISQAKEDKHSMVSLIYGI